MYTNLGDDAVVHALNETGVSVVVTSHELLPRFKKMLNNLPNITTIVYMEDQLQKTSLNGYKDDVNIKAFRQIVATVSLVNISKVLFGFLFCNLSFLGS